MIKILAISIFSSSLGFAGGTDPNVLIFKPDNSKQCENNSGISLDQTAKELLGIKIYSKSKQDDGKMYAAVCGGKTGRLNVFEISQKDLSKAIKLGFTEKK